MRPPEHLELDAGSVQVEAEVQRPERPAAEPFFFLTHGAGGDRNTPGLRALAETLAEAGHLVVRADLPYRAAGRKSPPVAERSVPGLSAAYSDAVERLGAERLWVVGGRSYGGRVASMAVAGGVDAAGLLLYSYPLHRPGDPSELRVDHWPRIEVPVLLLEGDGDPFCDLSLLRQMLPRIKGRATLHVVPGGDHSLKVGAAKAPDGQARSAVAVVRTLGPVVEEWAKVLVQAP